MRRNRIRVTGFTRFLLVMIIVVPLAYLGASYINGEDGMSKIQSWFKGEKTTERVETNRNNSNRGNNTANFNEEFEALQQTINSMNDRLDQLSRENKQLREEIKRKDAEIRRLQQQ
jgi:peptidoglycan hydrolase CwlO-like protein